MVVVVVYQKNWASKLTCVLVHQKRTTINIFFSFWYIHPVAVRDHKSSTSVNKDKITSSEEEAALRWVNVALLSLMMLWWERVNLSRLMCWGREEGAYDIPCKIMSLYYFPSVKCLVSIATHSSDSDVLQHKEKLRWKLLYPIVPNGY